MGCTNQQQEGLSEKSLEVRLQRMKLEIDQKTSKLKGEEKKQEKYLITQIHKEIKQRTKVKEEVIITQITLIRNKIHIYQVVKALILKALLYIHHINQLERAKIILYSETILMDVDISNVCSQIKQYFKQIKEASDSQIPSPILLHHKKQVNPTPTMLNQYVLLFCNSKNLDLSQINRIGHCYQYGK